MNQKLVELSLKSQREGRVIFAYDWNSKSYFEIQGMRIQRIDQKTYLKKQGKVLGKL